MSFRSFLLTEGLSVNAAPGLEEYIPQAKAALVSYLQRYGDSQELKSASGRYNYVLVKYSPDKWSDTKRLYFKYDVIDKGKGREEIITDPTDWRHEYGNWDGKTGKKVFKSPKDAIESIPADPALAYRGMSWEEWKGIQKNGLIQSRGQHNFSNQTNLTFYGPSPGTGENYAGGFAPTSYGPSPKKPGVVISVPRALLKTPKDNPNIPNGELASEGPLDAKNIKNVWMLVTTKVKPGTFDLEINKRTGKVKEGCEQLA